MKKIFSLLFLSTVLFSCTSNTKTEDRNADSAAANAPATASTPAVSNDVNIDDIPVSEKDPGVFPYLQPPADYCYGYCNNWKGTIRPEDVKENDSEYFAVDGKLVKKTGKTYKATLEKNRAKDDKRFESAFVEDSYSATIGELGGVQVNEKTIPKEEIRRVGDEELIDKKYGHSIDYNLLDRVKTYVIRTKEKEIWIQFCLMNEESGRITILEAPENK
ncbi:MAG: hypothetical protein INR69_08085 [Mucilaginibacter polytrichastri]|nr:hypothetical protein [Mucilaginibacter polytrichastri]